MAKFTREDRLLQELKKMVADHRKQINTLLFRVEDLEAAMDDARQQQERQQELLRRRRAPAKAGVRRVTSV